ncbi:LOW QUALITY PROTEIN: hypothetical protein Cgig2_002671 [Carnegiea gigantea]|uniref:Uncharacterized protein n=1 Tax=Carnegiea gigantea TaxID=171969 RepID=A0A9Q1K394_9CARY|nr:LOW QUALITY PROTEIN: hypothetical protein Cgig2_002671 [Carnegiea gigantea]
MIRLPICFGDKLKSKNLEVNVLVIDVPTAYNVILGHLTLHKREVIHQALHYPHDPPPHTPWPQHIGVGCVIPCTLILAGRRDKLHLLGVMTFIFGPLMLVYIVQSCSLAWATLSALVATLASAFVSGSSSWCCKLFFSASRASRSAFSFSQNRWYRVKSPSNLRHSVAALTPLANASAITISSSMTFGGSKVPGVAKSDDLTKYWTRKNLAAGSTLMKLVDGRRWRNAGSLRSGPYGLRKGSLFLETRSSVPSRLTSGVLRGRPFSSGFSRMSRDGCHGLIGMALDSLTLSNQ